MNIHRFTASTNVRRCCTWLNISIVGLLLLLLYHCSEAADNSTTNTSVPSPAPPVGDRVRTSWTETPSKSLNVTPTESGSFESFTPTESLSMTRTVEPIPTLTDIPTITVTTSLSSSFSDTLPMSGGYLQWDLGGGEWSADVIPEIHDSKLVDSDVTLEGRVLHDTFSPYASSRVETTPMDVNITLVEFLQQPRGVMSRRTKGFILTSHSFRFNVTRFSITFFMDDFFEIREDETLNLKFNKNLTTSGKPLLNELRIKVIAEKFPRNEETVGMIGLCGAGSSLMYLLFGVPGAVEVQTLVMIGQLTCIDKNVATYADGTDILLAPIPLEYSPHGKAAGNSIISLYVALLQTCVVIVIVKSIPKMSKEEVYERTRCPSIFFSVFALTFSGFCFFAVRFLHGVIAGGLTVLMILMMILWIAAVAYSVHYQENHKVFRDRSFIPFREAKYCWMEIVNPNGRWSPTRVNLMYRSFIGEMRAHYSWLPRAPLVVGGVTGVASALQPSARSTCRAQFAGMSFIFFLIAITHAVIRPYRYAIHNLAGGLSYLVLIAFTFALAMNDERTEQVVMYCIFFFAAMSVVRTIFTIAMIIREAMVERRQKMRSEALERASGLLHAQQLAPLPPPEPLPPVVESEGEGSEVSSQR